MNGRDEWRAVETLMTKTNKIWFRGELMKTFFRKLKIKEIYNGKKKAYD